MCLHHCPGHPVTVFDKPFHAEKVPNIQCEPTLEQPDTISLLTAAYLQAAVETDKVSSLLEQPLPPGTRFVMFFVVMDQKIAIKSL